MQSNPGGFTMNFIVVAFYTENTPYEEEIKNLEESLKGFAFQSTIMSYESRGSWVENAGIKPEFIQTMLNLHQGSDILYVDADAVFRQEPIFFENFDGDIGVHFRNGTELLSGTIYLNNNERTHECVRLWIEKQQAEPTKWDQLSLHSVIKELPDLKVVDLPMEYTFIFDKFKGKCGGPVIEHFQASRKYRRIIT